jgi:hypothetical protein
MLERGVYRLVSVAANGGGGENGITRSSGDEMKRLAAT